MKISEVEDPYFTTPQPGPDNYNDYDDYDYPDDDASSVSSRSSSSSSSSASSQVDESLYERLVALKEIIPTSTRARLAYTLEKTYKVVSKGLKIGGTVAWYVGTSALILGVPFAVAIGDEQQMLEMEREAERVGNVAQVSPMYTSGHAES